MLTALSVRDIVLIEALDLEFGGGLAVLTGATGAGKSIMLDSLGLVLGQRADAGPVRQGAAQGVVSARFDIAADHPVQLLIRERSGERRVGKECVRSFRSRRSRYN